jgi:ribonuclease HII
VPSKRTDPPNLAMEKTLWSWGLRSPAGVDEAGRGAWAGPVAAAAVILPSEERILTTLYGVRDSKQMTPRERENFAKIIKVEVVAWFVGLASSKEIDTLGILSATRLAMKRAVDGLSSPPDHLLIDALLLPAVDIPQTAVIKGDALVLSIAAASVLAKTFRDENLARLEDEFPGYGFDRHKGYGTRMHQERLAALGPCPAHRFSYAPVKALLPGQV